jgi:BirA family biotin operon repressor/biotin-[acetyl-CoA-carboxylase] ligase
MKIVKVDATTSTNELSKALNTKGQHENFCVSAEFQLNGRGQQNTSWQSNRSENLMFTVVYNNINLDVDKRFCLNALVCLSIFNVLKSLDIKNLNLKWPNDILADDFKVGGVLIENSIVGTTIKHSYVGIGLNVNQTRFENLPKASSLKILNGTEFDKDKLLGRLIEELKDVPKEMESNSAQNIINVYKRYLFGFNVKKEFQLPDLTIKRGRIRDIELEGRLLIEFESGEINSFEHKSVKQLY